MRGRLRLLLADDRPALARALRDLGAEVILAGPGQELKSMAVEEDAAVVIGASDLQERMVLSPECSDDDLLQAVRDQMESTSA